MPDVYGYDLNDDKGMTLSVVYGSANAGPAGPAGGPRPWSPTSGVFPSGTKANDIFVAISSGTVDGVHFDVGDFLIATKNGASTGNFNGNWLQQQPAINATKQAREEALKAAEDAVAAAERAATSVSKAASQAVNIGFSPTANNDRINVQAAIDYATKKALDALTEVQPVARGGTSSNNPIGARRNLGLLSGATTAVVDNDDLTQETGAMPTRGNVDKYIPMKMNAFGATPMFAPRAWVNFAGDGTIRQQGNVASITKLGNGEYRITFTVEMDKLWFCTFGTAQRNVSYGISTADLSIAVKQGPSRNQEKSYVDVSFRNSATGSLESPNFASIVVLC